MDEIRRAAEARMILDHELVREALASLREGIESQRLRAPVKDTDLHTRLIMLEQVAHGFEAWFRRAIESGEMAEVRLREPKFAMFRR